METLNKCFTTIQHCLIFAIGILSIISCKTQASSSRPPLCIPCSTQILKETNDSIGNLSNDKFEIFLCTLKSECVNNAEFMEFSNEILFAVLQKYTSRFIVIFKKSSTIDKVFILKHLSSPILDYNNSEIIAKINKATGDSETKKIITDALTPN